jgi:hypothetical protein
MDDPSASTSPRNRTNRTVYIRPGVDDQAATVSHEKEIDARRRRFVHCNPAAAKMSRAKQAGEVGASKARGNRAHRFAPRNSAKVPNILLRRFVPFGPSGWQKLTVGSA